MVDVFAKCFDVILDEDVLLGGTNWNNAHHPGVRGGIAVVLGGIACQLLRLLAGHPIKVRAHYDDWTPRGTQL